MCFAIVSMPLGEVLLRQALRDLAGNIGWGCLFLVFHGVHYAAGTGLAQQKSPAEAGLLKIKAMCLHQTHGAGGAVGWPLAPSMAAPMFSGGT